MANVTLFVRYIELKGYTANLLIINQLQNGFLNCGPPTFILILRFCFAFLYEFYKIVYNFTK